MPGVDFSHAPAWLQWVLIGVVIVGALSAAGVFTRKAWRWFSRFVTTVNALAELPEFITEQGTFRAETKASLASQDTKIAEIHHETHENNGTSIKDSQRRTENTLDRVERGVKGLYDRMDDAERELEQTRPRPPKPITPRSRTPKKE